jgi:hypothetical protein
VVGRWIIVYHRRQLGETNGNHRETWMDKLIFNADGTIQPVKVTFEGIKKRKLPKKQVRNRRLLKDKTGYFHSEEIRIKI